MSVDAIGLSANLLKAVKECGYKNLTPIQQQAIPMIRSGVDVLASAQTGTGKTAAFSLPILDALAKASKSDVVDDNTVRNIRALILTPTRELAAQVAENIIAYSQFLPLKVGVVYGGGKMPSQTSLLKQGVDILVATPGRLLEHLNLRNVNLSQVKYLVLDEADRMLDMGFLTDIEKLTLAVKQKHQTLMFSATYSNKVKSLANTLLTTPKTIGVAKQNSTSGKIKQSVYWVSEARKRELLSELIGVNNWQQVLVFAGTKESANILAKELKLDGIKAALCHGDKTQGARNKALSDFSEGKVRVLVATDVAARGLDIENLAYVVNFHLPFLAEDYVHRVGRTGRAGKSGTAISLVSPKDERFLENIEALIERKFERIIVPGYELKKDEALEYQQIIEKRASKNRYRANQEKNQAIEKKKQTTRTSNKKYNVKIKKKR
ncbi:DEAD/DEAH box helicase [Colwellia sp. 1_MG-2023]|uniref:DEAD/DEAH box helicase n=1 Tax=unclassified Colwellia TaxID=196834 RepID=UPI001C0837A2|nr:MULTISPECIES: DEAD/DEAH box helicase [unclassified Colwellia]MBU2926537.1 DEAD/DEAH box helicase [Colwellia sp. C2M11]MDO6652575.1 DEAD/DEAH box helicase [Colwellia sp. 3_MG-2023]MDO6665176.1 DEAD/DEAH box helicase [Colwellia sp. 2_MG-2023]MDO6689502.1 DEAD/DEAH box helicase [Colwellia sp. 1_MG-2023]